MSVPPSIIRACMLYEFKLGTKAVQAAQKICQAFGEGSASICTSQQWFKRFASGDESLEDSSQTCQVLSQRFKEYCISKNLPTPSYDIVSACGPAHQPEFIMSCSVGSMCKEASALTKKAAKQEVAKKVWEYFTQTIDQSVIDSVDKLHIDDINSITKNVLQTYERQKQKSILPRSPLQINQYHEVLTNLFCNISKTQMQCLIIMYKMKICYSKDLSNLKNIISNALKTTVQKITFESKNEQFVIGVRLTTEPPILQIGRGTTNEQAERQALHKLIEYILLFFLEDNIITY